MRSAGGGQTPRTKRQALIREGQGGGVWSLVGWALVGWAEGAVWLGLDEGGLVFPLLGGCCSGVRGDPHWLFSSLSLSSAPFHWDIGGEDCSAGH